MIHTVTGFPQCGGAIDGKHIRLDQPANSGSQFRNYKGFDSINLQACADANYQFIFAECGMTGRAHDATALAGTKFYNDLKAGRINLPGPRPVNGGQESLPFVFLGDEAYGLERNFVQPFPQRDLSPENLIYNKMHCKARRYVECAFGIMTKQFGILQRPIGCFKLRTIELIVLALCILHNILRQHSPKYRELEIDDDEDLQQFDHNDPQPSAPQGNDSTGRDTREMFKRHFLERGPQRQN